MLWVRRYLCRPLIYSYMGQARKSFGVIQLNSTTILSVLGRFHCEICYLSSLGKIWESAGLKDIIVNSDVYAEGTLYMILQGKEFNRGIQTFILTYETLSATI